MNNIFVSIITPVYNDWDRLAICLKALANQSYPAHLYEIIVVNNNPGMLFRKISIYQLTVRSLQKKNLVPMPPEIRASCFPGAKFSDSPIPTAYLTKTG
ncbi:glycosyltransferase [Anseongella ginsenosidimutans]|uniref:glycosyltransferase n=1 Tax=Anseongella ginsenosidimutans TaxID=496056 RepID=UPI0011CBDEC2|nr:glycosyltransferase family 2 protein [Anseongella ginsenosidimutans]